MLFEQRLWAGLADGTVTVTFRRWRQPRARAGARHRTPAGILAVDAVTEVDPAAISDDDARAAGFGSRAELLARLGRLDRAGRDGPWTAATLRLIGDRPGVRAADLAAAVGRERHPFKTDVRKLKELGLTESLEVGYRLSPRGRALLSRPGTSAPSAGGGGSVPGS
jgi:hypothetical protein